MYAQPSKKQRSKITDTVSIDLFKIDTKFR